MSRESAELSLESSLNYLTSHFASYNYWANKTIVEWLENKSSELIGKEITSSFPTLEQTLAHIQENKTAGFQS